MKSLEEAKHVTKTKIALFCGFLVYCEDTCVEPSLFTQTFQKPKKYFVKNLLSHFEKRPKRRDSYQVSFSATFLKQTLTIYNCTVPQKVKNEQYYWKLIVINVPTIILAYYPPWAKKFFTTSTGGTLSQIWKKTAF